MESIKDLKIGCKDFLTHVKKKCVKDMLLKHGKAFALKPHEIGCVDLSVIVPMVNFSSTTLKRNHTQPY